VSRAISNLAAPLGVVVVVESARSVPDVVLELFWLGVLGVLGVLGGRDRIQWLAGFAAFTGAVGHLT